MFELYGRKQKGLKVQYYINGKLSTFSEVLEDFGRADKMLSEITSPQRK